MTKIRILPLRSVMIDDVLATEGHEVEVDQSEAAGLVQDGFAQLADVPVAVGAFAQPADAPEAVEATEADTQTV